MKDFFKIAAATPSLELGNPERNVEEVIRLVCDAAKDGVAAIVFPELSLTGYTCGDLFYRDDLQERARAALSRLASETANLPIVSIVGLPIREGGAIYNAAAIVGGGEVRGFVRKHILPNYAEYYEKRQFTPAPTDEVVKVFDLGAFRLGIEICEDAWSPVPPSSVMATAGVDVVFNLSASTDFLGKAARRSEMARQQSARLGCVYAMACAGTGESCSDAVFGGASLVAANGRILAELPRFHGESRTVTAVVDLAALRYRRLGDSSDGEVRGTARPPEVVRFPLAVPTAEPSAVSRTPFEDVYGEDDWPHGILAIQSVALSRRMCSAHAKKLVIGVSGGADSALALMGAVAALRRLALPATNLIAIVMPGFGSTERTQTAAVRLSEAVGATVRVIDIQAACRRHLADIGHAEDVHDIAYENVQARERTQVLMDVANMEGALVVGTGDLSEIALGWNTYNGDHMSMYQINASVPKTMVLGALRGLAADAEEPLKSLLLGIAESPITPELVPGAVANDSESRLGPYPLHDFFLYHFLAEGASEEKLRDLAATAFKGVYPPEVIERTCKTFIRRFFAAQYKRNCVPDGPKITLSLSPRADWRMPADIPYSGV